MATKKKMLQAAAGQAGGAGGGGLDIDEVFSTYLYEGTGSARTITNGIDLSGEGGMLWIKSRTESEYNWVTDSERTLSDALATNDTTPLLEYTNRVTGYTSSGFTLGTRGEVNANSQDFASWTFRKAPKFFTCVTWTGDGATGRSIGHSLNSSVGTIIVKRTDSADYWFVYHRSIGAGNLILLDVANAASAHAAWNSTEPTSTEFTVSGNDTNRSGASYVAYIFAHNDGDGEFGPDGDQDIIKCGSFTDSGSSSSPTDVNLGFEPQWLLVKASSTSSDWYLIDVMREMSVNDARYLRPNLSNAETNFSVGYFKPTPTGFQFRGDFFGAGEEAIYIAIRRGPLAPPEDATEVFDVVNGGPDHNSVPFPTDFVITTTQGVGSDNWTLTRLSGDRYMRLNGTDAEGSYNFQNIFADMSGTDWTSVWWNPSATNTVGWHWKRAPGFCDVVCWSGDGTGSARIIPHNLTVEPEIIISKQRNGTSGWSVYVKDLWTSGSYLSMELTTSAAASSNGSIPNSSVHRYPFRTGDANAGDNITNFCAQGLNNSGETYIAYLFSTLDGISKVGSYTGNGSSQTIDCGFTSGARFILIKKSSGTGSWVVHDAERGIVSGNDPTLLLNSTSAEITTIDPVDPDSTGFIVNNYGDWNSSGETYIFYAIA